MLILGLPTPTNLRAVGDRVSLIRLSWNYSCTIGRDMSFKILYRNLNSSDSVPVTIQGTHNLSSSFKLILDNTSCDVFSFQVVATGLDGSNSSNWSEPIATRLPSLPRVEPIESSLLYSLSKNENGVMLNFTFDVSMHDKSVDAMLTTSISI